MIKKIIVFLATCMWNVLFFYLCGYWQQMHLNAEWFIDLFFGVLAVILMAFGEANVIWQIYYRNKLRTCTKKVFDKKYIRQCVLLMLYHAIVLYFLRVIVFVQSVFYISLLAVVLSLGWLRGSKTLWTSEEASYFLTETGKLYHVESVMENEKVFELACTREGERDRTITIEKKAVIE